MTKVDFEELFNRSKALELKDNIFQLREEDLNKKTEQQNDVFEKLRKGYEFSGHEIGTETAQMNLEELREELVALEDKFRQINSNASGDKYDVIKEKERLIIRLVELTVLRWNSLSESRNKWRLERLVIQSQEKVLLEDEYIKLNKLPKEDPLYQKRAEPIYKMHHHLLNEQEKIIDQEEIALQELEDIHSIRKQLYDIAVELFIA